MSNAVWKGIFLVVLLFVGDPFLTLEAQTMPPAQLAHNTSKT
jgi:hypothetical protein